MNLLRKRHSSLVLNLLIAIVITLTVNFSYLLSIIVDQRETTGGPQQEPEVVVVQARPEVRGQLHLSKDGYGYILCDTLINTPHGEGHLDSIFVSNR